MKIICLIFLSLISAAAYSQSEAEQRRYRGVLSSLYLHHQPSAKGEAMGRGLVANYEGSFGSYYNPALTSLSKGINFDFSYSEADNIKPSLSYFGVSYSDEKLGSIGISAYYFSKPTEPYNSFRPRLLLKHYDALFTVNYSREIVKDFYAGVNFGVFHFSQYFVDGLSYTYYNVYDGATLDIGLLKKFHISSTENKHILSFGTAVYNAANSQIPFEESEYKEPLPVVLRIGASHQLFFEGKDVKKSEYPLKIFTHIEIQKILNAEHDLTFKLGEEFTMWDILSVRAGYFLSKVHEEFFSWSPSEYDYEINFGAGINIPLQKLLKTKNPFNIKIDYTKTSITDFHSFYYYDEDKFSHLGLSINYIP